jgi:hypothetical protein
LYANEKDYWRDFAEDARRMGSPLYAHLAVAIDGDEGLKALTAKRRPGQPAANLLLAAVHYLLLKGDPHPLRNHYATLGGGAPIEGVFPVFQDFATRHEAALRQLIETRVTNTNEVGRSAILRAGFAALAQDEGAKLNLIEIGPSAGLNLNWDKYGVRYHREGATVATALPDSGLVLDCEIKGDAMPPTEPLPHLGRRLGLELHPVDLTNDDDRSWLRALVWPDQPQRLARLDAAIAAFLRAPAQVRGGDALALLPEALAQMPRDEAVCVYHTIVTYQFSAAMREGLEALLTAASLRRPVWHLSLEFDGQSGFALTLARHHDGLVRSRVLGSASAHGAWLAWQKG